MMQKLRQNLQKSHMLTMTVSVRECMQRLVYVNCDAEADAAKYTALVEKAAGLGRTLILGCTDPEIAKAALEVCKDRQTGS